MSVAAPPLRVPASDLQQVATAILVGAGVPRADASQVAETLVHADLRGIHSHGIRLLGYYVNALAKGALNAAGNVRETRSGAGFAVYDGGHTLGQVAARIAMKRAIDFAKIRGVGTTVVHNAGHFGAAGYWALMAAESGCFGYCTSTVPGAVMLAFGSREGATGNTPVAWALPSMDTAPMVLDMACGAAALGKAGLARVAHVAVPAGLFADGEGNLTTNAEKVKFVLPAAGPKGYGLSVVHDALAGNLSGAGATLEKTAGSPAEPIRGGQFFLALDISHVMPLDAFSRAMDAQLRAINELPPAVGFDRVTIPGQIEAERMAERLARGIPFPPGVLEELDPLAGNLSLKLPWRH